MTDLSDLFSFIARRGSERALNSSPRVPRKSAASASLCVLLTLCLSLSLTACGGSFPGVLPQAPLWVSADLNLLSSQEPDVLYGRGQVSELTRIQQRRLMAESEAIKAVRERFESRLLSLMKSGNGNERPRRSDEEQQAVRELLAHFPWSQAVLIEQRFFDAKLNTQHALASLTLASFERALSFDPSEATTKGVALEYARLTFKSLKL